MICRKLAEAAESWETLLGGSSIAPRGPSSSALELEGPPATCYPLCLEMGLLPEHMHPGKLKWELGFGVFFKHHWIPVSLFRYVDILKEEHLFSAKNTLYFFSWSRRTKAGTRSTSLSKTWLHCPTKVPCLDTGTGPLFPVCSEVFLTDPQIHVWFFFPGSTQQFTKTSWFWM